MPEDFRIRVGTAVGLIPLKGTPQQIANALRRFARSMGIPISGTDNENLVFLLQHWEDEVIRTSKRDQVAELDAASHATNLATADAENPP